MYKKKISFILAVLFLLGPAVFAVTVSVTAATKMGIINTLHNLSITGPGATLPGGIYSPSETRICVFCHTPHNAAPKTPLWNKSINAVYYDVYASSTLHVTPSQPTGSSRLCLSCHDGTIALGNVLHPSQGIQVVGQIAYGRNSYLGTVLTGDHPFSFPYNAATINYEIVPSAPPSMVLFGSAHTVECSTCHDPHEDPFRSPDLTGRLTGKFLVVPNHYSYLCLECHVIDGWLDNPHKSSTATINGALPLSPKNWPTWLSVAEWGCEGCHTSHSAAGKKRLLYYLREENNCYTCHNGSVARFNIYAEFTNASKVSHHPVEAATIDVTPGAHDPAESPVMITGHVECVDCHNPHATNPFASSAPYVSGKLDKVKGVDMNGSATNWSTFEYQICFKCHADSVPAIPSTSGFVRISRVAGTTNKRLQFNTNNVSFHPVEGIGKNTSVPSIPSSYIPTMTISSIIYCFDCHECDDSRGIPGTGNTGPRGPHGSIYAPLLREQYVTTPGLSSYSYQKYALCYRCHNATSIISQTPVSGSFSYHYSHIVTDNAPCSACHDPHGIPPDSALGLTGTKSHRGLINFDTSYVWGVGSTSYTPLNPPLFYSTTPGYGTCTLDCHLPGNVHSHNASTYPAGSSPVMLHSIGTQSFPLGRKRR